VPFKLELEAADDREPVEVGPAPEAADALEVEVEVEDPAEESVIAAPVPRVWEEAALDEAVDDEL
jgi:hypothetical protein